MSKQIDGQITIEESLQHLSECFSFYNGFMGVDVDE